MDPTVVHLAPLLDPIVQVVGTVVAGVGAILAAKIVSVLQQRLHVQLTEQQVKAVHDAADTAAGVAVMMLHRGEIEAEDVHITDPRVRSLAQVALQAVPAAAAATGITAPELAHIIVGRVGKLIATDPTVDTIPATPAVAVPAPMVMPAATPPPSNPETPAP